MKIAVCYVAVTHGPITADYCSRFVATYQEYPPGAEHDLYILCNGGPLPYATALIFAPLNPRFYPRQNDPGWDISAYIDAARGPCKDYDMMLCLGESCHFHKAGWLLPIAEAIKMYGVGMYGPFASNLIRPHLNTSAFCCHPALLGQFPFVVNSHDARYEFEHGERSFWKWVDRQKRPVRMVTWDGTWKPREWRVPNNILWRGDQTNCLMWCNHTERWANAPVKLKNTWSRGADSRFA